MDNNETTTQPDGEDIYFAPNQLPQEEPAPVEEAKPVAAVSEDKLEEARAHSYHEGKTDTAVATTVTEEKVERPKAYPYEGKKSNATIRESIDKPDTLPPTDEDWKLPSRMYEQERFDEDNPDLVYTADQPNDWKETKSQAMNAIPRAGLYQARFYDQESDFRQGVTTPEGRLLEISPLKFKQTEGEIKGEMALLKIYKKLGSGEVVNVMLPHSGIWVTLKPPAESDLIDFYNTVIRDKVVLGRATMGLTLTNFSVYSNNRLFDFITRYIHGVNYEDINANNLKDKMLINDFPALVLGMACAMFPNGFNYQRACVEDPKVCNHVVRKTINLPKIMWVDHSALTVGQKAILAENRPNKNKMDTYNRYIADQTRFMSKDVKLSDDITIKLRLPTFSEFTTDGLSWINKINNSIEEVVLDVGSEEEQKKELLVQRVKATALAQFNHYVDSVEVDENVITDRKTITSVLESLSGDDAIRKKLQGAIMKFKEDTTIALVGIPAYKCPSCGADQNTDKEGKHPDVIPLDPVNLFFLALHSKIKKITERDV